MSTTLSLSSLVTKDKRIDLLEKQTSRNVFSCRLIGPKDVGKSVFIRRFLGTTTNLTNRSASYAKTDNIYNNYAVNIVNIYGQKKYLIVSVAIHVLQLLLTNFP